MLSGLSVLMSFVHEQLVQIVSEDLSFCTLISSHLDKMGLKVLLSHDQSHAVDLFQKFHPNIILTDLNTPQVDGLKILEQVKKQSSVPVLISATASEIGNSLERIQFLGGDYILKPISTELLYRRLLFLLNPDSFIDDKNLATIIGGIHSAHDTGKLFESIYSACMKLSGAQFGLLHIYNKDTGTLLVVQPEDRSQTMHSVLSGNDEWAIPNWVFFNKKMIKVNLGEASPEMETDLYRCSAASALSVPFFSGEEILGIITLFWNDSNISTNEKFISNLQTILYQAVLAFNNIIQVTAINQKLDELMLVSTYSEKLMGLVDKYDIIRSLFETTFRYFPIDITGFLVIQKRSHEFLYWSRGLVEEKYIRNICKDTVDSFNRMAAVRVQEQRVRIRKLPQPEKNNTIISKQLSFSHVIPVCWNDYKFGAVFFGAIKELNNEQEKLAMLSSMVSQTRIALNNSKLYSDMKENYIRTIKALAIAVDAKDTYTHGHSENVMNIAEEIAREMGLDEKGIGIIRDAGLLHDIGKIGIPGYILNKPGPLTYEEFNGIMKTHSTLGANIVKEVPFLYDLHKLILYHHEHYDGEGYPEKLKGEQIPLGARILHVADAFEAMTSNRPYRSSLGKKEAIRRLIENSGKQFDPTVIKAFLRIAEKKGWIDWQEEIAETLREKSGLKATL